VCYYQNIFCRRDDPVEKALQTMRRKRMNALAVLDRNRNVVGAVLFDEVLKRTVSGQKPNAARSTSQVKQLTASPSGDRARRRVSGLEVGKARADQSRYNAPGRCLVNHAIANPSKVVDNTD
jgi:CBS domain-containing protein